MNTSLSSEIAALTLEHLELVFVSMLIAIAAAVPAGVFITRRPAWRPVQFVHTPRSQCTMR